MKNIRRTVLAALAPIVLVSLPVLTASSADAALMPYIVNRIESEYNLSVSITTPGITLKSLAPGRGAPAYKFYSSCAYTTVYWQIGGAPAKTAPPCSWIAVPTGKDWQVMTMPKVR